MEANNSTTTTAPATNPTDGAPNLAEIQKQVEYYLSNDNLKHDEFFHKMIKESPTASVPIDALLNCNKLKKLNATKDQIVSALTNSTQIQVTSDASGVKRSSEEDLPEYEPRPSKKIKGEKGEKKAKENKEGDEEESSTFEPKIFKITLSQASEEAKWDKVEKEIEAAIGMKIGYTRLNGTEGHFAVNFNDLNAEGKEKILAAQVKIGEIDVKIEECGGDDLKEFQEQHGGHLNMCLERSGLKKKSFRGGNRGGNRGGKRGGRGYRGRGGRR